jgi:predicted methyltransferase
LKQNRNDVTILATAAITFSKKLLAQALGPGDAAVDATAGNGNDAVFLAGLVGPGGVVHCFDIQAEALTRTRARLEDAGLLQAARLYATGHEHLGDALPEAQRGRIKAVVFNLGFLPGGDASVVTRPETTLAALDASRELLDPGGVISVVCYTGHPGGLAEAQGVQAWCEALDFAAWRAARYELANKPGHAIRLFFVEKRG